MSKTVIELLSVLEPICCAVAILALFKSRQAKQFASFAGLMIIRLIADLLCLGLLEGSSRIIEKHLAYRLYFYTYWVSFAVEALMCLYVIFGVFRLAMAPLPGLQRLGTLVFQWAAAISVALALAVGITPHQSGAQFFAATTSQLQQISSILTLCLLLFVCFAVRPMGLSFRSRIFGVSLGLGIISASNLTQAAWIIHSPQLYSFMNIVTGCIGCSTLLGWSLYFALPEPKRRIIVLPTTSPFLRWNQISEVLGDEPGFVAVAGIPPEVFAPAELEIMVRASAKMSLGSEYNPLESDRTLESLTA
jgi:hypothetical protein